VSAVVDKLREARALIERGWTQRAYERCDGSVCAMGAIEHACGGCWSDHPDVVSALRRGIGVPQADDIFYWNDSVFRTQAEVLAAFDKAIKLAERDQ
jgi:hypothetical protein